MGIVPGKVLINPAAWRPPAGPLPKKLVPALGVVAVSRVLFQSNIEPDY
jgi:hypothetical protein